MECLSTLTLIAYSLVIWSLGLLLGISIERERWESRQHQDLMERTAPPQKKQGPDS